MPRPRRSERIARELAANPAAPLEDRHFSRFILRHLWKLVDDSTSDGSVDSLRLARVCCRIASRLNTNARARSFARLASALRVAGRLGHADRALEIALAAAPDYAQGDVLRRRSILRMYQGRLAEAQEDADAAVDRTTGVEHTRALEASGVTFYYRGEHRASITQLGRCLAEIHPDDGRYCNAIQNYATALSKGTVEEMQNALKLCMAARALLKPRHKIQRAKLHWTEGLLYLRLGKHKKAWSSLNTARRSLIALEAGPEVAAIIADMARVSQQPTAIREICYEATEVITARHPLTQPLRALARAARQVIPEAAAALREEAARLTPCLAL